MASDSSPQGAQGEPCEARGGAANWGMQRAARRQCQASARASANAKEPFPVGTGPGTCQLTSCRGCEPSICPAWKGFQVKRSASPGPDKELRQQG